jgi:50S ribosomal subunit-associated GTPase HflX
LYKDELLHKQRVIVLNKIDLLNDDSTIDQLMAKLHKLGHDVLPVSALEGVGLDALKKKIGEIMDEISDS